MQKERSIHLRENQTASKICHVQGIVRSTCFYNVTAPNEMFKNAIWSFVWQEPQPLVNCEVSISSRNFGGLDVPHLPSEINPIQIQSLFTASVYTDWMNYAFYWFQNIGGLYRLGIRAFGAANWELSGRLVAVRPPFYRHLLKVWQKCGGTRKPVKPRFYEEACAEALWGNAHITDEHNRPLYYPSLARSGYIAVHDFYSKPRPPSNTVSHSVYSALDRAIPQHLRTLLKASCCFQNKWMRELHVFRNGGCSTSIQDISTKKAHEHFKASFTESPP